MSFPDIPDGMGVPLVTLDDHLLPTPTMDALDARYASSSDGLPAGGDDGDILTRGSGTAISWQPHAFVTGDGVTDIVSITRTAYDALGSYDPTTLYVIDEDA